MDADWDALGQAHSGEDGVDGGDALTVGLGIWWNVDGASDAVDVAAQDLPIADQLDFSLISHADRSEVRDLVPVEGLEPPTHGLQNRCSTT
jgi:hypothetical protein